MDVIILISYSYNSIIGVKVRNMYSVVFYICFLRCRMIKVRDPFLAFTPVVFEI